MIPLFSRPELLYRTIRNCQEDAAIFSQLTFRHGRNLSNPIDFNKRNGRDLCKYHKSEAV